jgi:Icc-related predicted phosphoesterase
VWLQATELREQRDEFERMADAQQKQVELLVTQGKIFEKEQLERQQESERKLVDEFLAGFCDIIRLFADGHNNFVVAGKNGGTQYHYFFEGLSEINDGDLLKKLAFFPPDIVGGITKLQKAGDTFISGPTRDDFIDLNDRIYQAVVRLDDLSDDQKQRIINYGVEEIHSWLNEIIEHDFWSSFANARQT